MEHTLECTTLLANQSVAFAPICNYAVIVIFFSSVYTLLINLQQREIIISHLQQPNIYI